MDLDWTSLVEFINTTAFPIAMCIILIWIGNSTLKGLKESLTNLQQSTEANSKLIERLLERTEKDTTNE